MSGVSLDLDFYLFTNECDTGGSHVQLAHPTLEHRFCGDGNRAFSYMTTGTENQHFEVCCCTVEHLRSIGHKLLGNFIDDVWKSTFQTQG